MKNKRLTKEQRDYIESEGINIVLSWTDSLYQRMLEWNDTEFNVYIDEYNKLDKLSYIDINNNFHPRRYNIDYPVLKYNLDFHDDIFIKFYSDPILRKKYWDMVAKKDYFIVFTYEELAENKLIRSIIIKQRKKKQLIK